MLRLFFAVAFRNLLKNKLFTGINLFGLALGIASSFLVFIYVFYHFSFDSKYRDTEIYRVLTDTYSTDGDFVKQFAFSMHFLGPAVEKDFSQVTDAVRLFEFETVLLYYGDDIFFNKSILGADENVISFFDFELLRSNGDNPLGAPNTAVLTESMAKAIFKGENPIGQTIRVGYGFHEPLSYKVTGVIKDTPANSHFKLDVLTSAITVDSFLGQFTMFNGGDANYYYPMFDTYMKIQDGTDPERLESDLNKYLKDKQGRVLAKYGDRELHLQHINDIHLRAGADPDYLGGMERRSLVRSDEIDKRTITWIMYGAIILLLFSVFNYINLTYINSIKRLKEIALRKIFGSTMIKIYQQFFVESLVMTLVASFLAAFIIALSLKPFYNLLDLPESFTILDNPYTYLVFGVFVLLIVLLKSLLLYVVLISVNFISLHKEKSGVNDSSAYLRRILMVSQLAASFVLISGTLLLSRQIDFFFQKDLGFKDDNIMVIRKYTMASGIETIMLDYLQSFKNELTKSPDVEALSLSTITPGFFYNTSQAIWQSPENKFQANSVFTDADYADVYDLKLLAGRFFTSTRENEQRNLLVNRKLMELLGYDDPETIIGQTVYIDDASAHYIPAGGHVVIGVLENFHQEPLSNTIKPMKFHMFNNNRGFYGIRLAEGADVTRATAHIESVFNKFYPKDELDMYALSDFLAEQYKTDNQVKTIMQIYTYFSIIIAYLGLLAFSVYMIQQKKKAIAIRKVLGSTMGNIMKVLLKEYVYLVIASLIFALPITYLAVSDVFENYAYQINIGWKEFLITGVLLILVVIGTISYQALKATKENPVKSLKYE